MQPTRLEADDPAARVGKREQEAPLEVIAAARPRETCLAQLLDARSPSRRPSARSRSPPSASPRRNSRQTSSARPASLQIVAGHAAGLGIPERALVVGRGLVEQRIEPLPPVAVGRLLRRRLLVLERESGTARRAIRRHPRSRVPGSPGRTGSCRPSDGSRSSRRACPWGSPRSSACAPRGTGSDRQAVRPACGAECGLRRAPTKSAPCLTASTELSLIRAISRASQRMRARTYRSCRR